MWCIVICIVSTITKNVYFSILDTPCSGARPVVDSNLSEGPTTPTAMWPISNDTHGDDGEPNRLYANLYNIPLMEGPTESNLISMNFTGQSGSYVRIPNDGTLDGNKAFSWIFYVYIDEQQNSRLFEYSGANNDNGLFVDLDGRALTVGIYDTNGVHVANFTSQVWIFEREWTYVGISYNMYWGLFDIYAYFLDDDDINLDLDTYYLPEVNIELNALGDVLFGAGDSGSRFTGRLSCLQFYNASITGDFRRDALLNCNSWTPSIAGN